MDPLLDLSLEIKKGLDAGILPSGPLLFKFRDIHASRRVKLTVQ
jgi:hypothetical protein